MYGNPVALPAPKHRVLLLALLLRNGMSCSTDQLIDALWDRPPASAGKVLQAYVSHLRSVLGADLIETVPTGYRLEVDPDRIDAHRFEQLLDRARSSLDAGDLALAASLSTRALGLWRGPALADVAYESFARQDAARLEELRMFCVEVRLDADLTGGHSDRVIAELASLCKRHPERESFHERLALALYRSSRQADALATIAQARRHLAEELGLEPGRALRELEHAILVQDPSLEVPRVTEQPGALSVPRPTGELVGRRRELDDLRALLIDDEARILTVTGPGGSGKTRLVVEIARRAHPYFAHGVVMVELASVADPDLVIPTIAQVLGLSETAAQAAPEVLAEWLRARQMLLVLDTFEHLADAGAAVAALIRDAPLMSLLVTSRRVLHLRDERVYPLGPMALDDAGRLFALRASIRDPDLRLDGGDEVVRDICTRLDCLPLAVEIAAARTATTDPSIVRDRLRADLGALGPGPRDAPARQQTLADTIRWTTDQLSSAERRTLAHLAVFVGGCEPASAEQVCGGDVDAIGSLVEWSLVQASAVPARRYSMLDTIHHHANELLDETGSALMRRSHTASTISPWPSRRSPRVRRSPTCFDPWIRRSTTSVLRTTGPRPAAITMLRSGSRLRSIPTGTSAACSGRGVIGCCPHWRRAPRMVRSRRGRTACSPACCTC